MRVTRLRLTNFRSHRDYLLENIPKTLIITGRNAAGKSSILEALTWGLCGVTQHTTNSGAGSDCLIMDGETQGLVELGIQTGENRHTIKRSCSPHKLSVDESQGGVRRSEELLSVILSPIKPDDLLMAMEPHRILMLSDKDRRKWLSEAVGLYGRTDEQKEADLIQWLPTIGIPTDSPEGRAAIRCCHETTPKTYEEFYRRRTAANLKAVMHESQIIADVKVPEGGIPEDVALATRQLYLRRTRAELELALAERAAGIEKSAAIIKRPNVSLIQEKANNLSTILEEVRRAVTTRDQRVTLLRSQIDQVTSAAKQCPVFARVCPLPGEEIEQLVSTATIQISAEEKALSKDRKKLEASQKVLDQCKNELAVAEKELEEYKDLWASGDEIRFEELRPIDVIRKDMEDIDAQIKVLSDLATNVRILSLNNENGRQALAARADASTLDILVKAFAPAGIASMLLAQYLPNLETVATAASRMITRGRYEITFSAAEGDLDISVISGGRRRPITTLSTSEKVWVSYVIQHVINQLKGIPILVLDEASILDAEMAAGLEEFLMAQDAYTNVFVCATTDDANFLPRVTQDVRRVRL